MCLAFLYFYSHFSRQLISQWIKLFPRCHLSGTAKSLAQWYIDFSTSNCPKIVAILTIFWFFHISSSFFLFLFYFCSEIKGQFSISKWALKKCRVGLAMGKGVQMKTEKVRRDLLKMKKRE